MHIEQNSNKQPDSLADALRDYDAAWQQLAFAFSTPVQTILDDLHTNRPHRAQSPDSGAHDAQVVQS